MNLTDHFTLEEMTFSSTSERMGINNSASPEVVENLKRVAVGLETIRSILGHPMHIDSGYRCRPLNSAIGGATNSAHMDGHAADFICPAFGSPLDIVRELMKHDELKFDRLIQEGHWVHISFAPSMRQQVETATFKDGKATYTLGVPA